MVSLKCRGHWNRNYHTAWLGKARTGFPRWGWGGLRILCVHRWHTHRQGPFSVQGLAPGRHSSDWTVIRAARVCSRVWTRWRGSLRPLPPGTFSLTLLGASDPGSVAPPLSHKSGPPCRTSEAPQPLCKSALQPPSPGRTCWAPVRGAAIRRSPWRLMGVCWGLWLRESRTPAQTCAAPRARPEPPPGPHRGWWHSPVGPAGWQSRHGRARVLRCHYREGEASPPAGSVFFPRWDLWKHFPRGTDRGGLQSRWESGWRSAKWTWGHDIFARHFD